MATENFAQQHFDKTINISFHGKYAAREFGVDYGERYHLDPLYRLEQDRKAAIGYHQRFGKYGMGDPNPQPSIGVGIQPLDFMNGAMGGRFHYSPDESVWTPDKPLAHIETMADVERLVDIDWEQNPVYQDLFRQIKVLQEAFPNLPVAGIQSVHPDGTNGDHTFLVMHTPYTTAFRLLGERILELMMLEEELSFALLNWIMCQYKNLWTTICQRQGWIGTKVHFGDCAATMLSPSLYENILLPMYQELMADYEGAVIHSCGPSSHLLTWFSQVPRVRQLQLGDGTDLRRARQLFPKSAINAYYDPGKLIADKPDHVERRLVEMCEALEDNFMISCGGADPDTPAANVQVFLDAPAKLLKK